MRFDLRVGVPEPVVFIIVVHIPTKYIFSSGHFDTITELTTGVGEVFTSLQVAKGPLVSMLSCHPLDSKAVNFYSKLKEFSPTHCLVATTMAFPAQD
jgi:hypothetical protein